MIVALLVVILALLVVMTVRDVRNHNSLKHWIVIAANNPTRARALLIQQTKAESQAGDDEET